MNTLENHVLLALAARPLYGYAIRDAIDSDSGGSLVPRAGSLYRVLARLVAAGLVIETEPQDDLPPHPGHPRRYYELTAAGRQVLAAEARRLRHAATAAEERLGIIRGQS